MIHDVAIVGFGPVGALLANLLGQAGLSVVVLEREAGIHPLPRAVHFDGEVLRIFQAADLAERIAAVARPSSQGMHFTSPAGKTLLVRRGSEGPGPQGWTNNWYFHQPDLETVLRAGARRFPNVEIKLGHEVRRIHENEGAAVLEVEDLAPSERHRIAARHVVGCDGARSLVRQTIGSAMQDLGLHQPWLVVDLLVRPESKRVQRLPPYTVQLCDPQRPMTMVNIGGRRRRWEIMLMPGDDPATMTAPERFWPMLAPWIGPRDAAIERSALYTFHSVVAERWRRGRLLLAGDSCHQTPPFLGQGMCAGMRDASNLAWKLAMVLGGRAGEDLLDTYQSERRPHVEAFIELAVRLGAIIQTTDPQAAAERDRRLGAEPQMFDFPQPQLGPGARDDAPPPVGTIFPQPVLDDGRRLDEHIGNRFAVIGEPTLLAIAGEATRRRWEQTGAVVIDARAPELANWLLQHGTRALVLRPDRYVFGLATSAERLDALIRRLPGNCRDHGPSGPLMEICNKEQERA